MFSEKISSVTTLDGRVSKLVSDNARIDVKCNGNLLKQNKVTHNHGPIVNIYIVYRLVPTAKYSSTTLQNCLFGAVKLTKSNGRNVIIFGADLSSSTHANNETRDIVVLGKDFIQGIDGITVYPKKMH